MTQKEIREMASEMIGDGGTPNKYFVTRTPMCFLNPKDEEMSVIPSFFGMVDESIFTEVFDTLEEAENAFNDIELDFEAGVGQVAIEDRETGIVSEKILRATVTYEAERTY